MRSWGLPPDFLRSLVAPAHFMRSRPAGTAYAVTSSAAYRKSGSPHRFRPRYALANLGHPSYSFGLCYDTDSIGTHLEIVLTQNLQPDVFSFTAH
jgi:hypothetical protein